MRGRSKARAGILLLRGAVLAAVLLHASLAAGDLSDPAFFVAATVAMAILGTAAAVWRLRWAPAAALFAAVPFVVRSALLGAAYLSGDLSPAGSGAAGMDAAGMDAALLAFDRNSLVACVPMLWAAVSAYAAAGSRRFAAAETMVNGVILTALFTAFPARLSAVYQRPIAAAMVVAPLVAAELVLLAADRPAGGGRRSGRLRSAGGVALSAGLICLLASLLFIKPIEDRAVKRGGGLIKPTLFHSDFSQFLKLESEISLDDDLALIVHRESGVESTLMRRYILSRYEGRVGFLPDERDQAEHPASLPGGERTFPSQGGKLTRRTEQEYYLVNFDSSAFFAMNKPVRVRPFAPWNASSFSSVYRVDSEVSEALPFELADAVPEGDYSAVEAALGADEYRRLTDYGGDPRIRALAEEIAEGGGYWDRTQAVYERLKFGEFRYSLKPGIAADGDQIGRFLFESKKGYCSYFAFSMTLILRSLGIPSRVAVGFFLDPATGVFDYYPVRSNMAHAWVEVFFPGYGWIDYDPTTDQVAEGETFRPPSGLEAKDFERLIQEIFVNRQSLSGRNEDADVEAPLLRALRTAGEALRRYWPALIAALWLLASVVRRAGRYAASFLVRSPRARAAALFGHAVRRLESAGLRRARSEHYGEFSRRADARWPGLGFAELNAFRERFLFAPDFDGGDLAAMRLSYRSFSAALGRRVPPAARVLAWLLPFPPPRRSAALSVLLLALLSAALGGGDRAYAAEDGNPGEADDQLLRAEALLSEERWEQAIAALREAKAAHPGDPRFPVSLGDVFAERKLYGLAWDEYRAAEKLDAEDPALLHKLATTAGHLNQDALSASYLERMLERAPGDLEAIGDLSWMYFKLHRLRDGERLLLDAIRRYGDDAGFSMTLGTIYSDLYEYDESRKWYLAAIQDSKATGAKTFQAVARYNLSILESKFYRYAQAFEQTYISLATADRASGHLARGELYLKRLDFPKTYAEYERAYALDVSPLSKINLAEAYRVAGKLPEALAYAQDAMAVTDHSWMINYGTNVNQFKRDLHDILSSSYRGLAEIERTAPRSGPLDAAAGLGRELSYRSRSAVHGALHRKYALACAREFMAVGQTLDGWTNFLTAFSEYPGRARRYLERAREFEVARVPASATVYDVERASLERDPVALEAAIAALDPVWQRDIASEALAELAAMRGAGPERARSAAERAYALNRGVLRQNGLKLPARLVVSSDAWKPKDLRRIEGMIEASLIDPVPAEADAAYELSVRIAEGAAVCELRDLRRGVALFTKTLPLGSASRVELVAFVRLLAERLSANP